MTGEQLRRMYRLLAIAKYDERYVIPLAHVEGEDVDAARHLGLEELPGCSVGAPGGSPYPAAHKPGAPVPVAIESLPPDEEPGHCRAPPGRPRRRRHRRSGRRHRGEVMTFELTLLPGSATGPEEALTDLGPIPVPDGDPQPAAEPRAVAWAAAALLLSYPDEAIRSALPAIGAALAEVADRLPGAVVRPLHEQVAELVAAPALTAQRHYVEIFDTKRRCCPYLTYYLHGDTRRRGVALWRVKASLQACGVEPRDGELPDHLSVVCELAAVADEQVALTLLGEHRAGLTLLAQALQQADSGYARVVTAIEALLPPADDAAHTVAAALASSGPPSEHVGRAGWTAPFTALTDDRGARR